MGELNIGVRVEMLLNPAVVFRSVEVLLAFGRYPRVLAEIGKQLEV